jgi:predicted HTH transcriptional regulator
MHRDYTVIGSEVHVDMYDDRLEIYSPGGMFDGTLIQERNIDIVPSRRRNPIIAEIFHRLGFIERRGSGLKKIRDATADLYGYTSEFAPKFVSTRTEFYVVLKNMNYSKGSKGPNGSDSGFVGSDDGSAGSVPERIIRILANNPDATYDELAKELNLGRRTVQRHIKSLKEAGKLRRIGSERSGHWEVTYGDIS